MRLLLSKKLVILLLSVLFAVILLLSALLYQLLTQSSAPQKTASSPERKKQTYIIRSVLAQSTFTYDHAKFAAEGYPQPQNPNPVKLDPAAFKIWQSYVMKPVVKAANEVGIDAGFLGSWSFMEGINYHMGFSNCNEGGDRFNPNKACMSNNWQVGHGIRPAENIKALKKALTVMYGSADNATIKRVGQSVIDTIAQRHPESKITYPSSTFPSMSIQQLVNGMGNAEIRTWVGHLMRDDAIYAYLQALTMKYHWDRSEPLASIMENYWGSASHYNRQRVINYVKATYDGGVSDTGSTGGGAMSGSETLTLVVRPKDPDSWVINTVTAQAIGGGSGTGSSTTGSNGLVNPNATCPGKGPITCGSYDNPTAEGWGHCNATYMAGVSGASSWCYMSGGQRSAAYYGIDIDNGLYDPVYIPKISVGGELRTVSCIFADYIDSAGLPQTILVLSCTDDKTDEPVWMQFHHSDINSKTAKPGVIYKSGEPITKTGNFNGNEHVHFQIGIGAPCGSDTSGCVNADEYVQCN